MFVRIFLFEPPVQPKKNKKEQKLHDKKVYYKACEKTEKKARVIIWKLKSECCVVVWQLKDIDMIIVVVVAMTIIIIKMSK